MSRLVIQIYEIQTPEEAREMIDLGVDHVGSVITSREHRHDRQIRATIDMVRARGAVSSLIPLFTETDLVLDTVGYHRPDIVHFCDRLTADDKSALAAAKALQDRVKERFPEIRVMRSIPIAQPGFADSQKVLALADELEPVSDYFLTDTVIGTEAGANDDDQPVDGFVGITGLTCDWEVAAQLVSNSRIPVILAGGISADNVADGIRRVQPFGVDSCTCTNARDREGKPIRFQKDGQRVRQMIAAARRSHEAGRLPA